MERRRIVERFRRCGKLRARFPEPIQVRSHHKTKPYVLHTLKCVRLFFHVVSNPNLGTRPALKRFAFLWSARQVLYSASSSPPLISVDITPPPGIGKSSFIQLLCTGKPDAALPHTVGCSCEVLLHDYDETQSFFIEFVDVGGSQKHQRCRHLFFQDFDGIILVHDLTNRKSQSALDRWLAEIEDAYIAAGCDGSESDVASFVRVERHDSSDHIPSQAAAGVTSFNTIPRLFIGTKLDQMPAGYVSAYPRDEQGCDYADVSSTLPSIDTGKIQAFYNLVIQRKFFSGGHRRGSSGGSLVGLHGQTSSYSRSSGRRSTDLSSPGMYSPAQMGGPDSGGRIRQGSGGGGVAYGSHTPGLSSNSSMV